MMTTRSALRCGGRRRTRARRLLGRGRGKVELTFCGDGPSSGMARVTISPPARIRQNDCDSDSSLRLTTLVTVFANGVEKDGSELDE